MKKILQKILSNDKSFALGANEMLIWPDAKLRKRKEKSTSKFGLKILSNIHNPSITAYFPSSENATDTALIIAPGGGHRELWIENEGYNVAARFCELGIASFVLKYRLAGKFGSPYSVMKHSLADMQQAIRFVRSNAKKWSINPSRIGVMGFSAGGELAALSAIHFGDGIKNSDDKILQQSSYPDFQALIYPSCTENFIPKKNSPPLFSIAGEKDRYIAKNIGNLHNLYKEAGIPSFLHIYENEDHGFGIQPNNSEAIKNWPILLTEWLHEQGFA